MIFNNQVSSLYIDGMSTYASHCDNMTKVSRHSSLFKNVCSFFSDDMKQNIHDHIVSCPPDLGLPCIYDAVLYNYDHIKSRNTFEAPAKIMAHSASMAINTYTSICLKSKIYYHVSLLDNFDCLFSGVIDEKDLN